MARGTDDNLGWVLLPTGGALRMDAPRLNLPSPHTLEEIYDMEEISDMPATNLLTLVSLV